MMKEKPAPVIPVYVYVYGDPCAAETVPTKYGTMLKPAPYTRYEFEIAGKKYEFESYDLPEDDIDILEEYIRETLFLNDIREGDEEGHPAVLNDVSGFCYNIEEYKFLVPEHVAMELLEYLEKLSSKTKTNMEKN